MKILTCITVAYFVSTVMTVCLTSASTPTPVELPKDVSTTCDPVDVHSGNLYDALVGIFESHFDAKLKDLQNDMKSFVSENLAKTKKLIAANSKDIKANCKSDVQGLDRKFEKLLAEKFKNIKGNIYPRLEDLEDKIEKQNEEMTNMEQKNAELLERLKVNDEILMMNNDYTSCEGDTCFILIDKLATWMEANATCYRYGGFLAEVRNSVQADQISNLTKKVRPSVRGAWLGGNDLNNETQWQWEASSDKIPLRGKSGFQLWGPYEPNNAHNGQDCLMQGKIRADGKNWDDNICSTKLSSICQRPKQ